MFAGKGYFELSINSMFSTLILLRLLENNEKVKNERLLQTCSAKLLLGTVQALHDHSGNGVKAFKTLSEAKKSAKVNPLHKKELDRRVLEVKGDIYGILGQPDKALLTYNNVPMRLEDKKPEIVIYAASPENAVFRVFPASQ